MLLSDSSHHSRIGSHPTTMASNSQEAKAAISSCQGALRALLDSLRNRGVTGLEATLETADYWRTLQQAQDYCRIVLDEGEDETTTLLLLGCWQAVGRHTALTYKTVWMEYQSLRHFSSRKSSDADLLQRTVQLAERCSTCQREVMLLERRRHRLLRRQQLMTTGKATTTTV